MENDKVLAKYKIELREGKDRRLRVWRRLIPLVIIFVPAVIIMVICYILPVNEKLFFAILDTILIIFAFYSGKLVDTFTARGKLRFFYGPLVQHKLQELVGKRYQVTKDDAEMLLKPNSVIEFEDLVEDTLDQAPDFAEFGSLIKNMKEDERIRVTLIWDKRVGFYILERSVEYQPSFTDVPSDEAPAQDDQPT